MRKKLVRLGFGAAMMAVAAFGVTACGSDDAPANNGDTNISEEVSSEESAEFVADLQDGVQIINDQIAEVGEMTQIMLASDVDQPTQKYGMWVMPYYPSDAVESYISTIQVNDGQFVVTATSAETGTQWEMDQDGNMSEAAA